MNLRYLLPRVARHFMPPSLARWLLRRRLVIRPGLETSDPDTAAARYTAALDELGCSLENKRVMVFGYGGSFAVGCALLQSGAQHVILCDPYAPPDHDRNRALLSRYPRYLSQSGDQVFANPEIFTILEEDIRQAAAGKKIEPFDVVVSSSVYEHLDDVEGITGDLARLTHPDGLGLHFIDLRDHFFRYPFEMLCFSREAWNGWLNPTSNLNRYRLWDYRMVFERHYSRVDIEVLARDEVALEKIRPAVRREFLSGNLAEDTATSLRVAVFKPRP